MLNLYIVLTILVILFIIIILFCIFNNKNSNITDGEIIRIEKKLTYGSKVYYRTTVMYSYFVNDKKYINSMADPFKLSKILFKYVKNEVNNQSSVNEYVYYVKKKKIKVRYLINNPQDSVISNFLLKQFIFLMIVAITIATAMTLILALVFFMVL